ncbi:hypothetical protein GQ42DRAFT_173696 [Ramicandelaber brevisporus]|nr:hypothetical protein GQ42DRAFT_173696 [Ramicandelaber brevisporus]
MACVAWLLCLAVVRCVVVWLSRLARGSGLVPTCGGLDDIVAEVGESKVDADMNVSVDMNVDADVDVDVDCTVSADEDIAAVVADAVCRSCCGTTIRPVSPGSSCAFVNDCDGVSVAPVVMVAAAVDVAPDATDESVPALTTPVGRYTIIAGSVIIELFELVWWS